MAIAGLKGIILAITLHNSARIGKLQGRLENGDFLRCPFYRKGGSRGKGCQSDKETGSGGKA